MNEKTKYILIGFIIGVVIGVIVFYLLFTFRIIRPFIFGGFRNFTPSQRFPIRG
jgi:ABC-type lipoprotein release transport system permease subunit